MAYVYRHIRLDKNEPFYIGIGNDLTYSRANTISGRNPIWNRIVDKTDFEVEILFDDLTWDEACEKEIEFIALYGRKIDGGTLSNITKGGDGKLGVKPKNAWSKGHTPFMKGRTVPKEQVEKLASINRGRTPWNKGVPYKKESLEKQLKTKSANGTILKGEKHPMFGKTHSDELKDRWKVTRKGIMPPNAGLKWGDGIVVTQKMLNAQKGRRQKVYQYDLSEKLLNEFESIVEAEKITKVGKGNISHCLKGNRKTSGGFIWKNSPLDEA